MKNHRKNLTYRNKIGLEPRNAILAAMYILNRPVITFTFTAGNSVHDFVMDEEGGFNITQRNINILIGRIYSPCTLRKDYLPQPARFIESIEKEGYKLRLSGSFAA